MTPRRGPAPDRQPAGAPWGLGTLPPARPRAGAVAPRPGDVPQLSAWAAGTTSLSLRARVVLLTGRGLGSTEVAGALGVSRQTVHLWCGRYARDGLTGLADRARPLGRAVDDAAIIAATLTPPPAALGRTHWSARSVAAHLGVGHGTVARAWQAYGVRPHGLSTFRLDTSPTLLAHVADVVGLVVARDLRLVAVSTLPAGTTPGTRHHVAPAPRGRVPDRHLETGHGPLRAFAALRATLDRPPGRSRAPAGDAVRTVLGTRLPARGPDRRHELALIGDRPDVADLPELAAWRRAHPHAVVRHVDGTEQWLRLVEVMVRLAEARVTGLGFAGAAPELTTLLRGVVGGGLPLAEAFAWAHPTWRRPPGRTTTTAPVPRRVADERSPVS